MLKDGTIWQQIIGTYTDKDNLYDLVEILITMNILKLIKEESMGINVEYNKDKEKLTDIVNSLSLRLKELQNKDDYIEYPYINYTPKKEERLVLKIN